MERLPYHTGPTRRNDPSSTSIARPRFIDLLSLTAGVVIGVVGTVVATRLSQQSLEMSREALELGKWTAMKDWIEGCQARGSQEPACKAALANGLPPPPFLSETLATVDASAASLTNETATTTGLPIAFSDLSSVPLSTASLTGTPTYADTYLDVMYDAPSHSSAVGVTDAPSQIPTIMPTGTDPTTTWLPTHATTWPLPPNVVVQVDALGVLTDASPIRAGIPSSLPKVITPNGDVPTKPQNTTTIQIGFTIELPYPFVVASSVTAAQIFAFLPRGIAYALEVPVDQVVMHALVPYDTTKDLGYITTLALVYIPTDLVDQLALGLHTPHMSFYNNPDSAVFSLIDLINPSFPILAGQDLAGHGLGSGYTLGLADIGAGTSRGLVIISRGVGLCIAIGCVAYVAAAFVVRRRYRNRNIYKRVVRQRSLATQRKTPYYLWGQDEDDKLIERDGGGNTTLDKSPETKPEVRRRVGK